jgi:hypothetical protein
VRNCLTDEGRPLGTGLQGQVPNHLRRLWSKAMVVSTEGKGLARTRSGDRQEEDRKGTTMEASKAKGRCQNRGGVITAGRKLRRNLFTGGAASGVRGGLSLPRRRLSGTWEPETPMLTEKPQVEEPQGRAYGRGDSGAEQRVVAEKSPTKGWSEGAVTRSLIQ